MSDLAQSQQNTVPDMSGRPASMLTVILHFPLIFLLMFFLAYFIFLPSWSLEVITLGALVSAVYGIFLASRTESYPLNFTVVYGAYLSLSHLGLVASDLFVPGSLTHFMVKAGMLPVHLAWYYASTRIYAVALSGLGITTFFLGSGLIVRLLMGNRPLSPPRWNQKGNQSIFYTGVTLLVGCTIYIVVAFALRLLPLFASYTRYVESMAVLPGYSAFLALLSTGLTFILATGSAQQIRKTIVFFMIPAVLLVLTGNRGEIFYALAASVAIIGIRGYRLDYRAIVSFCVVLFVLIPLVRDIRQTPINEVQLSEISISFTDPFIEMGYQLRPLMATIGWIDSGEEFGGGETYILPFQRMIGLVIPFVERPAIEGNRLDVQGRLPTQGYTVIGEAYFNFGVLGVALILSCIGLLFSFANRVTTSRSLAFYGAIAAILINSQRNSFLFVPGQAVIVVLLVVVAHLLSGRRTATLDCSQTVG